MKCLAVKFGAAALRCRARWVLGRGGMTLSLVLTAALAGGAVAMQGQQPGSAAPVAAPAPAVAPAVQAPASTSAGVVVGGVLHGVIKAGSVPLPGVAVTATNTLTGKRFATTTDITGAWSMTIPQNGRYRSEERRVGKECLE